MNKSFEQQAKATKLVQAHRNDLRLRPSCRITKKIASSMGIHIAIDNYIEGKMLCANCLNENSIAKGDSDE